MIDIEYEMFDSIVKNLREQFSDIAVSGEENRVPAKFPFVSIVEADNSTFTRTQDSGSNENHANLMYEINVYSNKSSGKKSECKQIFSAIDCILLDFGFTRITKRPISMDDATIYRMIGRYTAVVSKEKMIYRR